MRIVIITQDDLFFLPRAIPYLYEYIGDKHKIVGCILLSASPFGKKEKFIKKLLKTRRIFGNMFLLRYGLRFLYSKIFTPNAMERIISGHGTKVIRLDESINVPASLEKISSFEPDIVVSIAGNEIFKKPLINLAPKGCLNLHTAELPRYRGLMPTFWVIKNQEPYTAVSVFLVDEGIDSGPIVVQVKVEVAEKTQEALIKETKKLGMECIARALDVMMQSNPSFIPNNTDESTYFGFPSAEDVKVFRAVGAKFY